MNWFETLKTWWSGFSFCRNKNRKFVCMSDCCRKSKLVVCYDEKCESDDDSGSDIEINISHTPDRPDSVKLK